MATLREVEDLLNQGLFRQAHDVLAQVPDSLAKSEYSEMFYRVWSYTEDVGLATMGGSS